MFKPPTMFSDEVNRDAREHAIAEYPKESVGFVVDNQYVAVENIHSEPEKHFRVSAKTFLELNPQSIIHSHPDVDLLEPSYDDQLLQIQYDLPFGLIKVTTDKVENKPQASAILWWGTGVPKQPLIGRPFVTGVWDCLAIVNDYYETELGISLPKVARDKDWWDLPKGAPRWNMIEEHFESFGFYRIDVKDIKPGDAVFFSILSKTNVANHCTIYEGGDSLIHHMPGISGREGLSRRDSAARMINSSLFKFVGRHRDVK